MESRLAGNQACANLVLPRAMPGGIGNRREHFHTSELSARGALVSRAPNPRGNSVRCLIARRGVRLPMLRSSGNAVPSIDSKEVSSVRYGAAPVRTQATARKCRETPMGRTALAGLRRRLKWLGYQRRVLPLCRRHHAPHALRRTVPNPRRGIERQNFRPAFCLGRVLRPERRMDLSAQPPPLRPSRTRGLFCRRTCNRKTRISVKPHSP